MKNLKRVLSLVLATVMVIGMMVVGASAADYKDAADIDFTEAVDVMSAVGMISGYDGNFGPNGKLDRAGAAKLIAYLTLGQKVADKLVVTSKPFNDVETNAWYAGYVAYCAEKGLLNGVGGGNFAPDAPITAYGFAKLLLGALGYDASIEGMTGDTWEVNTATLAIQNGLFDGNEGALGNEAMTRQEACLYAFNALKANTVGYTGGTTITLPGGGSIVTGATRYEKTNSTDPDYRVGNTTDKNVQLCEALYADLKLAAEGDSYGRPGHTWKYDDEPVAVAVKAPYATYAGEDFSKEVLDDLITAKKLNTHVGKYPVTLNTYDLKDAGDDIPTYDKLMGLSGQTALTGATVELYVSDKEVTNIVVRYAFIATVTGIETDEDTNVTTVTVQNLSFGDTYDYTFTISSKTNKATYALVKDYEEGEIFAAYFHGEKFWKDGESQSASTLIAVDDVDVVSGKITSVSTANNWVKVDGTKYNFARPYSGATLTAGHTGTFYLYNGVLMHFVDDADATVDTSSNVVYVIRTQPVTEWGVVDHYEAEVVFADGTTGIINIGDDDCNKEAMYTYKVKNDVYTLENGISSQGSKTFAKGVAALDTSVYANDKTVFVVMDYAGASVKSTKVYTGIKNIPNMEVFAYYPMFVKDANGSNTTMTSYVFCTLKTEKSTDASDLIYVAGASEEGPISEDINGETVTYYTYNAVIGGKLVEIKADTTGYAGLYDTATIDANGVYTISNAVVDDSEGDEQVDVDVDTDFTKAANGVVTIGGKTMTYADGLTVYVDNQGTISTMAITDKNVKSTEGKTNVTVSYTTVKNVVTGIYVTVTAL